MKEATNCHWTVYFYWSGSTFDFGHLMAIGSAALRSGLDVTVLVDEAPRKNRYFDLLRLIPHVTIQPLRLLDWMSEDMANLYHRFVYVAHRSDLVSFCVLSRTGGLYMDTDTLTIRSFAPSGQRLLFEDGEIVQTGVMAMPANDTLAILMLDEFRDLTNEELMAYESIVLRWSALARRLARQDDFGDSSKAFPVHWRDWEWIFSPPGREPSTTNKSVTTRPDVDVLHHYGYFSSKYTSQMSLTFLTTWPCWYSELALPVAYELRDQLRQVAKDPALEL
jgi:hypothetical protein